MLIVKIALWLVIFEGTIDMLNEPVKLSGPSPSTPFESTLARSTTIRLTVAIGPPAPTE